jgi:hypothetical protein
MRTLPVEASAILSRLRRRTRPGFDQIAGPGRLTWKRSCLLRAKWVYDLGTGSGGTMSRTAVRTVFAAAGLYDLVIGLAFLVAGRAVLDAGGVPYPNHWGYIQFSALLLIIFGIMFLAVARNLDANRSLMVYGMMLKLSYTGLVAFYWARNDCPWLFRSFAFIDAAMFVLFALAYYSTRPAR